MSTLLQDKIAALAPWHYNVYLPDGTATAPDLNQAGSPQQQWQAVKRLLPGDLTNWQVLEIGCSSGFYAIEMAKRGASVVVLDTNEHCIEQAKWLAEEFCLQHKIIFSNAQVYELARADVKFDLALCLDTALTLRYPQLAIDILAQKANKIIVADTYATVLDKDDMVNAATPAAMIFIEGDGHNNGGIWKPTADGLYTMLASAGYIVEHQFDGHIYVGEKSDEMMPYLYTMEYLSAAGIQ